VIDDESWYLGDPIKQLELSACGFLANACQFKGVSPIDDSDDTPMLDIPPGLSKPVTDLHEVQYAYAVKHPEVYDPVQLSASLYKEVTKIAETMGVFQPVCDVASEVDANAVFIPSMMLTKQKYFANGLKDSISCRLAMLGNRQSVEMCGDTYSATADDATMVCCMSAFQAHALQHNYVHDLEYMAFDVCGAFLHVD